MSRNKAALIVEEVVEVVEIPVVETPVVDASVPDAPKVVKVVEIFACGHINRQHTNIDGKLEGIACADIKGHAGDHSASVKVLRKQQFLQKDPELTYKFSGGVEYEVREEVTYWSDAAGTPADKVQPDYEGYANRKEWEEARKKLRSNSQIP